MPPSRVRADYEKLAQIAKSFNQQSDTVSQTLNDLKQKMSVLQGKDWIGKGADKFYGEMSSSVLPMLKRLAAALEQSARTTQKISQVMKQAENEAAAILKDQTGEGAKAKPGGSGGGILGKIGKAFSFVGDLFIGAGSELKDMVTGLAHMVIHPVDTLKGLWYGVTHPGELWEAFKKPYVEDWNNGHPGRAIGRGLMFVGSLLVGTKGADKAGKVGKVAGAAGKAGEVAGTAGKLAGWMEKLSAKLEATFKIKPRQVTSNVDDLYRMAGEAHPHLKSMTDDLAKATGGKADVAPLKDIEGAIEKVNGNYGGDFSHLRDVTRSRVVYNSLDDAYKGLQKLQDMTKDGGMVYFKDRFVHPTEVGFRDILVNVKMPNGHIAELRLTTEAMEKVAKIEHAATYQPIRSIERAAEQAGRDLTAAERATIAELRAPFQAQYAQVWNELTQGINRGSNIPQKVGQTGVAGEVLDTFHDAHHPEEE